MDDAIMNKMRKVRAKVDRIPQVVVLTKVDDICPKVAEDITIIYRSKKIRDKMEECSNRLGIPMNCIFPVKNYSEEIDLNHEVDVLLLSALKHILNYANDHVAKMAPPPANMRSSRHGLHMDTGDSMMEHRHYVNMRSSRHDLYTGSEDSSMKHGHPANMRSSRHGLHMDTEDSRMEHGLLDIDVNMRGRNWTDV